ncbi:TPA: MFS transporter, partial [Klebsiella pneumoniae subsp. pneumoniae]|nr:MFS transporter [Klebsiella pneumoniae subsp. pneumoniae]
MSMSNSQEVLTSTSGAKKRSRVRIVILLLLSVGTMINYLDRTILGIVAPQLSKEIHIDPAMMGIIFSAFAWTYALAQIPGGMFLDRFGNKVTYALSIFFWSLFTLLQSFTLGLKSLLLLRLGLGVSEAPCFPANSRIVSTWFPQHERARATATYTVGEYIGLAAFSPLLFLILEHHGWRTLFFLTGGLGILFTLVWWRFYHEPHESHTANQAELEYIGANS